MRHLPDSVSPESQARATRRAVLCLSLLGAAAALGCAQPAQAVGATVDVHVVDRDTGESLPVYRSGGRSFVAGRPGARYAIRVSNRTGERVMAVVSVDGVNVVTGQTASWNQSGYVFEPWQGYDLTGWRKSDSEVAAFEFTALPDSYAARTGRPLDVGVIGVAVFREKPRYHPQPVPPIGIPEPLSRQQGQGAAESAAPMAAPQAQSPARAGGGFAADSSGNAAERRAESPREKLGTGHGAREHSHTTRTTFERSTRRPVEIVSIQYDSQENLVAAGVIPSPTLHAQPRPFPGSRSAPGYVPDPPRY